MFCIDHLTYTISRQEILHNISLTIPKGKMTAIVGPNGCGKSTLLNHLSKRYPTRGKITLEGRDLASFSAGEFAQTVAMMNQSQEGLVGDFLTQDVVLLGRYPYRTRFGFYTQKDRKIVADCMATVGITHLYDRTMKSLSGGERQRVLIAKTLAQSTPFLLFDEPTNHLDIQYKVALMQTLQKWQGTVIIVLHDLGLAARYCDEVILMQDGRIQAQGHPREVMTPEILSTIFGVSFQAKLEDDIYYLFY